MTTTAQVHVTAGQRQVTLGPETFVADGGEAAVYAKGGVAYKVFRAGADPDRLRALAKLGVQGCVLPEEVLTDQAGRCVGHTMRFLGGAVPWARLLARSYCDRHGLGVDRLLALITALRDRVAAVHAAGALVVDLHEGNILLSEHHRDPTLIDTSSWQLPGFPATAVQDGIRDRHATAFDQGTDWFAFAVVTLHLLLGIHPYRGTHPSVRGLDERMRRRLSVLRPEVGRPAACRPVDAVPSRWRAWYRAVLDGDARCAPPAGPPGAITWSPRPTPRPGRVALTPVARADAPILSVADRAGCLVARVPGGAWWSGQVHARPAEVVVVTAEGRPVAAWRQGGKLHLYDLADDRPIACTLAADAVQCAGHRLVVRSGARLIEVRLHAMGAHILAVPRLLATVLPAATALFDGLAVEDLLGDTRLLLLGPGRCDVVPAPFLDGWTVLEARHHRGVVGLLARREGQTDRWVLRVGGGGPPDVRHTPDVAVADLDLVCLATGVCVVRAGSRLELFRARAGDPDLRTLEDPALCEGRLVPLDGALGWVRGATVHCAELRA